MNTFKIHNLNKSYQKRQVVNNVSLEINAGEVVGLLGPNGAGKTTSFYMIVGLIAVDSGQIELNGHDVTYSPMHKRARLGLSYLPQEASVFRRMTVEKNILAILETRQSLNKKQRQARCDQLLKEFNITKLRHSSAVSLSGGERRRLEIARALAIEPQYFLLDEPFAGIDPITVEEIQGMISDLSQRGIGVLITDHKVRETLGICNRAYIISDGQIIAEGTPEKITQNKEVKRVYLGDDFVL